MRNTTILRGAAIMLALFVTVDAAQAWTKTFRGTREQVRAACTGKGMDLIEGGDQTVCINSNKSTGVVCYDDGVCNGSGPRTIGAWGFRSQEYQAPQSLVGSGSPSGEAPGTPSAPAPSAPSGPIFN